MWDRVYLQGPSPLLSHLCFRVLQESQAWAGGRGTSVVRSSLAGTIATSSSLTASVLGAKAASDWAHVSTASRGAVDGDSEADVHDDEGMLEKPDDAE